MTVLSRMAAEIILNVPKARSATREDAFLKSLLLALNFPLTNPIDMLFALHSRISLTSALLVRVCKCASMMMIAIFCFQALLAIARFSRTNIISAIANRKLMAFHGFMYLFLLLL